MSDINIIDEIVTEYPLENHILECEPIFKGYYIRPRGTA